MTHLGNNNNNNNKRMHACSRESCLECVCVSSCIQCNKSLRDPLVNAMILGNTKGDSKKSKSKCVWMDAVEWNRQMIR